MLLLLVQGKLSNLTVEERFAFNISLRMFTRSIVIQRRVEDLQLGVESYQKRLNLTNPETYRSNLKRHEAYTAYSNPRGFIYQNKDKKNILMRIDELHKFSDGTLNDVRNALDDRIKGIQMQYLPTTIWRRGDKDRAAAMIRAIDKMLKTRRIMRSLEKFVGGRLYDKKEKSEKLGRVPTKMELILEHTQQEVVAIACFTQNRSIIRLRHGKTLYELMHDAPSSSKSLTPTEIQSSVILQDVGNDNLDIEVAHKGNDPLLGVHIPEVTSEQSSLMASPQSNVQPNHPMTHHNSKWTKDHP
nr:hypothetical protein [Tanacetum cinerariifolium]